MEEKISISLQEYNELKQKTDAYDESREIDHKNSLSSSFYTSQVTALPL